MLFNGKARWLFHVNEPTDWNVAGDEIQGGGCVRRYERFSGNYYRPTSKGVFLTEFSTLVTLPYMLQAGDIYFKIFFKCKISCQISDKEHCTWFTEKFLQVFIQIKSLNIPFFFFSCIAWFYFTLGGGHKAILLNEVDNELHSDCF